MAHPKSRLWPLAPAVHAVAVGADLVFLSVTADRYDCLPDGAAEAALTQDRRALRIRRPALADELLAAGLIVRRAGVASAGALPTLPSRPTRSALPPSPGPARWQDAPAIARGTLDFALGYGGRTFDQLLARARDARPGVATEGLLDTVAAFHRWSPYAPVPGQCLVRSFMLLRWLRRRGHAAVWVIAVATWPFRAHCWLQADDIVLDDTVERLQPYHPILAV